MPITAEQIFRSYLATNADPSTADIEDLCAAHPEAADELRQLYRSQQSTNAGAVGDATVVSSQRVPSETPATGYNTASATHVCVCVHGSFV